MSLQKVAKALRHSKGYQNLGYSEILVLVGTAENIGSVTLVGHTESYELSIAQLLSSQNS